ncbi:MAG: butyrate kinase [Oscillospiraceae bacterium]
MEKEFCILAINPGSSSTKLAVYSGSKPLAEQTIRHPSGLFAGMESLQQQIDLRMQALQDFLVQNNIQKSALDAVVGRGGLVRPVKSGTYTINEAMLQDLQKPSAARHASSLGAIMANHISGQLTIPAYIVDPVVVDELQPEARISGLPQIERQSIFHALNQKAVAREAAAQLGIPYQSARFVVAHMGGGVSVGAHNNGRVVDVNNALGGEGPFSPERCGGLPGEQLAELCFSGQYTKQEVMDWFHKSGGVQAYIGTADMMQAEQRCKEGDADALLLCGAMAYQIAKDIGGMMAVLCGQAHAIVLTGGLAHWQTLVLKVKEYVGGFAPVIVLPGEDEMKALIQGALRILQGQEEPRQYT